MVDLETPKSETYTEMVKNTLGNVSINLNRTNMKKWSKFTLIMIIFYLIGSLIIYSISMNNFFFEIMETPLAKLFGTSPGPDFRKVADPV